MTPTAAHPVERLLGRMLAHGLHPVAAWRVTHLRDRCALVIGYGVAGYVVALATFFAGDFLR